ncbi:immunoglobulin superfamily member 6 isoform X2 [Leptodactylus fuscus]|uniref:immunoglobulin superfamily member 6 isoform X2 n=1 Tax=Leptodactylus fuscus TaxID=238119 RepID=UPI003F4E9239
MEPGSRGGWIVLQLVLLHCHTGVRGCSVDVTQDDQCKALLEQKSVTLRCDIKATDCPATRSVVWFRYLASTHEEINGTVNRFKVEPANEKDGLKIENIEVADSGIYICGVTYPGYLQHTKTGRGTTLIIQEKPDVALTPATSALLVLCTLLTLYCTAVFSYYCYKTKWKFWKSAGTKRNATPKGNRNLRPRSIFQNIAAEYHRRYDRKIKMQNQVIEDETIYQNTQNLH